MDRRRYVQTVGTGIAVGLTSLAGCTSPGDGGGDGTETETGGGTDMGDPGSGGGTRTQGSDNSIDMVTADGSYYFDPVGLFVEPGTEITWVNQEGSHSTVAYVPENDQAENRRIPEGGENWNSDIYSEPDAEFTHTLETEGTYDYFCGPHKSLGMVGRIVVGSPGGPAEDSSPPDGELPDSSTIVDQGSVSWDEFSG